MRNALASVELLGCGVEVAKELELMDEPLVFGRIQDDGGSMAALGQNECPLRSPHLGKKPRRDRSNDRLAVTPLPRREAKQRGMVGLIRISRRLLVVLHDLEHVLGQDRGHSVDCLMTGETFRDQTSQLSGYGQLLAHGDLRLDCHVHGAMKSRVGQVVELLLTGTLDEIQPLALTESKPRLRIGSDIGIVKFHKQSPPP